MDKNTWTPAVDERFACFVPHEKERIFNPTNKYILRHIQCVCVMVVYINHIRAVEEDLICPGLVC